MFPGLYNEQVLRKAEELAKQKALSNFEDARKARAEAEQLLEGNEIKKTGGFVASLIETIVNNIQISVTNIHVRFEVTDVVQKPFTIGLTWESMKVVSTDPAGDEVFVKAGTEVSYKLLDLKGTSSHTSTAIPTSLQKVYGPQPKVSRPPVSFLDG